MHKKSETVLEGAPADFLLSEDCEKRIPFWFQYLIQVRTWSMHMVRN